MYYMLAALRGLKPCLVHPSAADELWYSAKHAHISCHEDDARVLHIGYR